MRLDPKYFNTFLVVVAVIAAAIIAFFTLNSQQSKRAAFKKRIVEQDSLRTVPWITIKSSDSLKIDDFENQYVLLQFWSGWMDDPELTHQELAQLREASAGKLAILSAMVGFKKEKAFSYVDKQDFPIEFVIGSKHFSNFGVPGVPAYLLYNPGKEISFISFGTLDETQIDSLAQIITMD